MHCSKQEPMVLQCQFTGKECLEFVEVLSTTYYTLIHVNHAEIGTVLLVSME